MRILLTNDDGFDAHGLHILKTIADQLSNDVWVAAPKYEQSGKGRGISLHDPIRVCQTSKKDFVIEGTPTDCVQIAINDLLPSPPDLILSGINRGFNIAQDITLSGTVAGALQALSFDIKAIALSQCLDFDVTHDDQWRASREHGAGVIQHLLECQWEKNMIFNINFPETSIMDSKDSDQDSAKGWYLTRQGFRDQHEMHVVKRSDPRGRDYYWIDFHSFEQTLEEGTDMWAIKNGLVSVTPIHLDLTHYPTLQKLKSRIGGALPKFRLT